MATAKLKTSSLNAAKKELEKCLETQLRKDLARHKAMASKAVLQLDVEDTGETARETTVKHDFSNSNQKVVTFYTPPEIEARKAIYPYLGLGSSRKYGPRDWLALGAALMFAFYNIKDNRLPNPNTTFTKR